MIVTDVALRCTLPRNHDGPHTDGAARWRRLAPVLAPARSFLEAYGWHGATARRTKPAAGAE